MTGGPRGTASRAGTYLHCAARPDLPGLQRGQVVQEAAVIPQRIAQVLGVRAVAVPLAAQAALTLPGRGHERLDRLGHEIGGRDDRGPGIVDERGLNGRKPVVQVRRVRRSAGR